MENNLVTAILVDGSTDPPALRIDKTERQKFISQGRAGNTPRNFEFVRPVTQKVEGEDEPRTVYLYKLRGLADEDFESVAMQKADEYLNPEKYVRLTSKPLNTDERAELDAYRRRFGTLKGDQ
jgi:hypothetical protein